MKRLTLALLCALAVATPAFGDDAGRKRSIDSRISLLQSHLERQKERESAIRSQIAGVTSRIRSLETQVGDVSLRLQTLEQDLALHQERLDALTELYRYQTKRFVALKRWHALSIQRLNARLVHIYESDEPSTLDVVLGASSIQDALDKLEYVKLIGQQDERIAREVGESKRVVRAARAQTAKIRTTVRQASQAIAVRASQTREVRNELVGARDDLSTSKQQKLEDLSKLSAEERADVEEIDALQQASQDLGAKIRAAQAQAAAPNGSVTSGAAPSASGFIWPASGPVTSPFGWRWGRMHEGIDIGAPYGAPIHAAAAGTVVYCGWMSGYGNLVAIDHGGGISTAYGHQSSIAVACGQHVDQGQTIGYIGSTGHSTGPHLHFEVRVNGNPVDPLGYL
ncbi:MAG TPA: peptidoglycan DD-metalloendopeptidase family protein [Gaiellaceae bacterium]|jgi:murein DD-endopeptidase MepM/ murein hydrolase activator NlpD